jgi:hypothetical protein
MTALEYDNLPDEVKNILSTYDYNAEMYKECIRIQNLLGSINWTCDYDLSGVIFDVKPLENI